MRNYASVTSRVVNKKFLENIHMTSIDNGLAVHYSNITDNKTD